MNDNVKKLKDLDKEKERLERLADDQLKQVKHNLVSVREESKSLMVKKILIPAGIALVAGYGLKKLIDYIQSDQETGTDHSPASVAADADTRSSHKSAQSHGNGLLSGINWSAMAVQLVPFVIKVGQRLYEDGNLPYFKPPTHSVEEE